MAETKRYTKKLLLLGDASVGKTSMIRRFVEDSFSDDYIATIGTKVSKKEVDTTYQDRDVHLTLQVWDVLGQHGYTGVQKASLTGAHGAILVCDSTSRKSLLNLAFYWLPLIYERSWNIPVFIAANKCDLEDIVIEAQEMARIGDLHYQGYPEGLLPFDEQRNIGYCSAKTGEMVEEIFERIAQMMLAAPALDDSITELLTLAASGALQIPTPKWTTKEYLDWVTHEYVNGPAIDDMRMHELRVEMLRAGIDVAHPEGGDFEQLIQCLYDREVGFLEPEEAERRFDERHRVLQDLRRA